MDEIIDVESAIKIRVLLADDHAMFRDALRMTLEVDPYIEVVSQADDGKAVLESMARIPVDVICIDICMAGLDGIETTRQLLQRFPETKVIGLSAHDNPTLVADMLRAGARGYVLKMDVSQELTDAIRRVHRNERYVSHALGTMGTAEPFFTTARICPDPM